MDIPSVLSVPVREPLRISPIRCFDSHAHLDDEQFQEDREEVVRRAVDAGVVRMIAVGTTAASSRECVRIAERYSEVDASVGIQPNHCAEEPVNAWDEILALATHGGVVALGETGLDRYWDRAPFSLQQDYFDRHLRLSQQSGLPFIVHMRDCEADVLAMLREARVRGPLRGVMHSYTGSEAGALECLELGLYISFAGMVTYKKADDLRRIAAVIPADRLLVETDSPYLTPHPHRGQRRNEPAMVMHTVRCLTEIRGVSVETLAEQIWQNSWRLFDRCR